MGASLLALAKSIYYGIRGIAYDCFSSYLTNCYPFVSIGNTSATSNPITCGVPQGSVHSPLYIIYRGYYTVARRYEFYFRVAKQYFTNERSE